MPKLSAKTASGRPAGPDEFVLTRKNSGYVPVEIKTLPLTIENKVIVLLSVLR